MNSNIFNLLSWNENIGKTERIISVASGIALIVTGIMTLKKTRAASWTEVATGTALVLRGATGYCPVNAALSRNTAKEEHENDPEAEEYDMAV